MSRRPDSASYDPKMAAAKSRTQGAHASPIVGLPGASTMRISRMTDRAASASCGYIGAGIMLRPSLIRSCQSRQAVLYSGVIHFPKEKRQPEDCPCLPLSAHVSPCHSPPHPSMPCPAEQSNAYRIPKHRTRCLRLLSAHTEPDLALPIHATPRRGAPAHAEPSRNQPCRVKLSASVNARDALTAVDSPCLSLPCPA